MGRDRGNYCNAARGEWKSRWEWDSSENLVGKVKHHQQCWRSKERWCAEWLMRFIVDSIPFTSCSLLPWLLMGGSNWNIYYRCIGWWYPILSFVTRQYVLESLEIWMYSTRVICFSSLSCGILHIYVISSRLSALCLHLKGSKFCWEHQRM